jgi:hypothetical protein
MWLVRWFPFLLFVQLAILVNTAMLGAYEPLNADSPRNMALDGSEWVFFAIFLFECVMKLFAMGVIMHNSSYFRDGWNWLDFIVVILSIISVLPIEGGTNLTAIRALRILRALRLLKVIPPLRILIEAVIQSIPDIANALVFLSAMLLGWSVIGMQAFGGKVLCFAGVSIFVFVFVLAFFSFSLTAKRWLQFLQHCVDPTTGLFDADATCAMNFAGQGWECAAPLICNVTTVNPLYGRSNYDNFAAAFMQAFQVVTQEDWSVIATFAMDSTSAGAIVYFVTEILFGTLILVNLFVAILTGVLDKVSTAAKLRKPAPPPRPLRWLQAQWARLGAAEAGRDERWRLFRWTHALVSSPVFAVVVYSLIVINFGVLCMEYFPMPTQYAQALYITNIVLNSLFTAEVVLRLLGLGVYLWAQDGFNIFDLVVVTGCWLELFLTDISIIRVLRSLRMFRLFSFWKAFNRTLRTVGIAIKV